MKLLNKIFGPSKDQIWRQFSARIGADYESGGHWFVESLIRVRHRNWTIVFDTHQLPGGRFPSACTRVHALYVNKDGFRFSLYRRGITSKLMKFLGVSHPKAGSPQMDSIEPPSGTADKADINQIDSNDCTFDENLILKTNDEAKLRMLFDNSKIHDLIQSQKSLSMETSELHRSGAQFSQSVYELRIYVDNIVRDMRGLEDLYKTAVYILGALYDIESADEDPPNVCG